jgi:hypothetical protein
MAWSIINLVLSLINAVMAWDSFKRGQPGLAWFNLAVSSFCFVAAVL